FCCSATRFTRIRSESGRMVMGLDLFSWNGTVFPEHSWETCEKYGSSQLCESIPDDDPRATNVIYGPIDGKTPHRSGRLAERHWVPPRGHCRRALAQAHCLQLSNLVVHDVLLPCDVWRGVGYLRSRNQSKQVPGHWQQTATPNLFAPQATTSAARSIKMSDPRHQFERVGGRDAGRQAQTRA